MSLKKSLKRIARNVSYLLKNDLLEVENERTFRLKDEIIEDVIYEFEEDKRLFPVLEILDADESVNVLLDNPKSFVRLGDGEIKIIQGIDQAFQKYDPVLAEGLERILKSNRNDMYVCINRAYFHSPIGCSEENYRFYRINNTQYRRFFLKYCKPEITYLDAGFLTAYYRFDDSYDFAGHYAKMEELFRSRKIAIVSGKGTIFGDVKFP